ncbi:MAG TPA: 50S ribosomal protein L11 methyltransferase [Thermoanaerobaculia bacterium]|nr:50S ribosomal protein L11 methyltransferase [Thermoanaerobaculia bacterium]
MDWDTPYVVSRSLMLEVSRQGRLVGWTSMSLPSSELDPEALPALLEFAAGSTPREAYERLSVEWEVEEAGFGETVESMLRQGFLVSTEGDAGPDLASERFGSAANHMSMLLDTVRMMSYRSAIERHASGQRVVEIGCGTGILSLFAARAGARKVIAIEESQIAEVAAAMFEANGVSGTVELKVGNSRNVEIGEPADLIVHEILGVDPFEENILPVLLDARRRFLRPGGRLLPHRLEVCCLGIDAGKAPGPSVAKMVANARELSGVYGFDFGPLVRVLESPGSRLAKGRVVINEGPFDRKILSEELLLLDLDLEGGDLEIVRPAPSASLRISAEGTLSGVALFFRAHLDERLRLTTSPNAPLTSWGWDVRMFSRSVPVRPGDEVPVSVDVENAFGRQWMAIDLRTQGARFLRGNGQGEGGDDR